MFRDTIRKLSLRKKLTILASVGVFLPVLVLSYMQYRSLAELQTKTKGAFKDNLRQGVTIFEHLMKQRLAEVAGQALNPIGTMQLPSPSSTQAMADLEKYFADVKRSHSEIEEIFVVTGSRDQQNVNSYVYSDKFITTAQAGFTPLQSDILSLFDKARMDQSFLDDSRKYLFVYHACPTCAANTRQGAYLFYPLTDRSGDQNSFAGILLSERFVTNELIAGSMAQIVNRYHGQAAESSDLAITVIDDNKQVLFSNAAAQDGYIFESNFDRPFSNWKAGVGLKNTNLDQLARDSFLHSAGLTLLVLAFLFGGMALIIRATDREARLAQAKSNFVSNVSHELKTPLSLLSLFSEILELGRVDSEEKRTEYYRIIRHESLRLNKMIDNVLDFAKIEAGRKTYVFVHSDMAEVIENVLASYRYQIINSGFDIQTNAPPRLPPVLIDRDAMAQVISNLIDNAIKYSGKAKQLTITTKTLPDNLSIEIADRGIGIPRTEQARIFEKFYRVGNGLVHDVKGSGLGLSLVKHIIEAHHGTISVESEVGAGSRFTILIPLAPVVQG